jgi:hypothetical protein
MALSWVKVSGAKNGRDIFVNGNFIDAAGTVGTPFRVETGMNTFALLKPDKSVERSVNAVVELHGDKGDPQVVNIGAGPAPAAPVPPAGGPTS